MNAETAQRVADVLKALAHPLRLRIIELLQDGRMCVGDIVEELGVKQSITSQHLNLMRNRQVLTCHRDGARIYYEIKNPNVIKLLRCVYDSCDKAANTEDN